MYIWCVDDEKERIINFAKRCLISKYKVKVISSLKVFEKELKNSKFKPDLIFADYMFNSEGTLIDFIQEKYGKSFPYHFIICSAYYDSKMILHASEVTNKAITALPKALQDNDKFDGLIMPEDRRNEIDAWFSRKMSDPYYYYEKYNLELFKRGPKEIFEYIIRNQLEKRGIMSEELIKILNYENYSSPSSTLHNHLSDLRKTLTDCSDLQLESSLDGYYIERELPLPQLEIL